MDVAPWKDSSSCHQNRIFFHKTTQVYKPLKREELTWLTPARIKRLLLQLVY